MTKGMAVTSWKTEMPMPKRAVPGPEFLLFEKLPADDGRRRLRHDGTDRKRAYGRHPDRPGGNGDRRGRQQDLRGSKRQQRSSHCPDLGERELVAYREQQEGDAEPSQGADILDARNQPQPMRSDNRSNQQVADNRRDAQPAKQGYGDDRRQE